MLYHEYRPHPELQCYIDAYWKVTIDKKTAIPNRILPDGCIDLILNLGDDFMTDSEQFLMKNEKVYLVGTMTRYKETMGKPGTRLLGVRFKPAAFTHFYNHALLHEITDKTVEGEKKLLPYINTSTKNITGHLNNFFLQKCSFPRNSLLSIVADIQQHKGQVSLEDLLKKHHITIRSLERYFKEHIGLSPQKFINFIRYQFAFKNIQINYSKKNLSDIAFDCGYCDHAHLSNEIKKYSGLVPSQI